MVPEYKRFSVRLCSVYQYLGMAIQASYFSLGEVVANRPLLTIKETTLSQSFLSNIEQPILRGTYPSSNEWINITLRK